MKRLSAAYRALVLVAPLLITTVLLAGPFGCGGGGGGGATPIPPQGFVEIGFVDSPVNGFQAISLNVVSVRLNPSTDAAVSDSDPNWVTVTAPPGTGANGELSINLLDFQNDAKVFNTGSVAAQVYHQVELIVDINFPGTIIPSCSQAAGSQEGCVDYSMVFGKGTNLRTSSTVNVNENGLTPLIIEISPTNIIPPSAPGGTYQVAPVISAVSSGFLAPIRGTVSGSPTTGETITAELTGTGMVVASATIPPSRSYTLQVPAGTEGTIYDLFVSGSTTTFDATSGVKVTRRVTPPARNFSVATANVGSISGTVIDGRTKQAISAATVNLLLPPTTSTNCATAPGCVVVATTASDSVGVYAFASVPFGTYAVQAQATGTNVVTHPIKLNASNGNVCTGSSNPGNCSFLMPNALINGSIKVEPQPAVGTNTVVLVMAEQGGTGNLVGLTQVVVQASASGPTPFSMEVPTIIDNKPANSFDLIASAQDSFLGVGTQFPGHTLAVAGNIDPKGSNVALTVGCVGHGTIIGRAINPDAGTHVRLFKVDPSARPTAAAVQLMDSTTGQPPGTATAGQYSFCAPPDEYVLQRFEESQLTASPVGTPTPIVVPTPPPVPTPTSTPCAVCKNSDGLCPGVCRATVANPL